MRYTVKKTFEVAQQTGIALIVQVKSNQPTLHQKIIDLAAVAAPLSSHHSHDKGRNRDETRTVGVFDPRTNSTTATGRATPMPSSVSSVSSTPATPRRAAEPHHRDRLLRLEQTTDCQPRSPGDPRALGDRDDLPLQPRRHLRRRPLAYPDQSRRIRPTEKFRLQHPQGKPHRHAQSGPISRRSRRLRPPVTTRHYLALNSRCPGGQIEGGPREGAGDIQCVGQGNRTAIHPSFAHMRNVGWRKPRRGLLARLVGDTD